MTTHADKAREHIAATRAAIEHVEHLHQNRSHDRAGIAAAYDAVRQGLKLAEVNALLAISDELRNLVGQAVDDAQVRLMTGELAVEPAPVQRTRYVVVAPTRQRAITWCHYHGVQPMSSATILATTPDNVYGLTIGYADEVVFVDGCTRTMAEALMPCYLGSDVEPPVEVTAALGEQ